MIEAELKFRADDLDETEEGIRRSGGVLNGKVFQSDIYYDHPGRNFAESDEALRVRTVESDGEKYRHMLTYKGPKLSGETGKSRVEHEVPVEDGEEARKILEALGFRKVLLIRKDRTVYRLKGVKVCLDRVKGLGEYVELEIPSTLENYQRDVRRMREVAGELGLAEEIRESYLELILSEEDRG